MPQAQSFRPDPTFYASPRLTMEAPAETIGYTLLLSPDHSKPDAIAIVDLDPDFLVTFAEGYDAHQVRLDGGDCSTDSFCYPSA